MRRGTDWVAVEAAQWLVRLSSDDVSAEDRADFQEWVASSPDHRLAYDEAQATWADLDALGGLAQTQPETLPCELRIEIKHSARLIDADRRRRSAANRAPWWAAAAAVVVLVLVKFAWVGLYGPQSNMNVSPAAASYETRVGERREILLADGSLVWLNTDTKAHVALTASKRRVHLGSGEAYFTVAKDADRPFVVTAGDRSVLAVGTEFNVHHRENQTTVTVVEGVVDVIRPLAAPLPATKSVEPNLAQERRRVRQSQVVTLGDAETEVVDLEPEAAARAASWRRGKLYFDAVTIEEMIFKLDPYVTERIVIADDSISGLVGGGVIHVDNVESIFKALEMIWPIRVEFESSNVIVIRGKR